MIRKIQEMLNQVCTRKVGYDDYELIPPNGYFDPATIQAISNLIYEFQNVKIDSTYGNIENNSYLIEKMQSLYEGVTPYNVITKELLYGDEDDPYDGLVDLYTDVTNLMELLIANAEAYVENEHDYYARKSALPIKAFLNDDDGTIDNTEEWDSLNWEIYQDQGVAYSFGGFDTVSEFNYLVPEDVDSWIGYQHGQRIGLHSDELAYYVQQKHDPTNFVYTTFPSVFTKVYSNNCYTIMQDTNIGQYEYICHTWPMGGNIILNYDYNNFATTKWRGIDCSGFVHQCMLSTGRGYFRDSPKYGTDHFEYDSDYTISFVNEKTLSFYTNYVRKGDLLISDGHMVIAYEDFIGVGNAAVNTNKIIHAQGYFTREYFSEGIDDNNVEECFSRKVIISPFKVWAYNQNDALTIPDYFCKIKLWE